MSAQDNLEKVLRDMHMLLSKSDPMPDHPGKVIVEKQKVLDLLSELNTSIYGIMDEYEMTARSRDKAEREFHKRGDEIIWDASRKAEDVYAASVMYTEEALTSVQEIMEQASNSLQEIYGQMTFKLDQEKKQISSNQSELKSQLRSLRDTEKYLRLIEDRNEEILKEKRVAGKATRNREANLYANRQTEIKINTEVLEQLGYAEDAPLDEGVSVVDSVSVDDSLDEIELYESKQTFSNIEEAMASEGKETKKKEPGSFTKMLKSLAGQGEN